MKTKVVIAALAAVALTGCSMLDVTTDESAQKKGREIRFSAYQEQSVMTRASGATAKVGDTMRIGMFAFYHPAGSSFGSAKTTPDFMYNQKIESIDGAPWSYSPIKYWPNAQGSKVSFFAYAPYEKTKSWESMGVTVSDTGKYMDVTFPVYNDADDQIDYLWAEPELNVGSSAAGGNYSNGDSLEFSFRHAMAKVYFLWGVDANDKFGEAKVTNWIDGNTQVSANYIKLEGVHTSLTMRYDLANGGDPVLTSKGSQDILLERRHFTEYRDITVTNNDLSMYHGLSTYLFLAPQDPSTDPIKVTLSYTVTTTDPENSANNSSVENVFTANLTDFHGMNNAVEYLTDVNVSPLEPGKAYWIYFLVGMNDVQVKATESSYSIEYPYWETLTPANQ